MKQICFKYINDISNSTSNKIFWIKQIWFVSLKLIFWNIKISLYKIYINIFNSYKIEFLQ